PVSADSVNSLNSLANSSRVMSPPFIVGRTLAHLAILKVGSRVADILRRGLFRGFRHDRARHAREPAVDELLEPGALGEIVHRAALEVLMARHGAGRSQAVV